MACKKYTITNNTNKIGTYSYQECSELVYVNDSQIRPGQTKNIWARDNTFNVSEFLQLEIVVENFPDTQVNTGPCSDVCSPALLWLNPNLNKTSLSIYDLASVIKGRHRCESCLFLLYRSLCPAKSISPVSLTKLTAAS